MTMAASVKGLFMSFVSQKCQIQMPYATAFLAKGLFFTHRTRV